jgi:hypothetical protein
MHCAKLASRTQKHGVKDLLPGVMGIVAPVRQSLYVRREIKYIV